MSLFPAYAKENENDNNKLSHETGNDNSNPEWLRFSSFKADIQVVGEQQKIVSSVNNNANQLFSSDDEEEEIQHKHKKKKLKKNHTVLPIEVQVEDWKIDKRGNKEFYKVKTISRPAVSHYRIKYYIRSNKRVKPKKFKRYFQAIHNINKGDKSNSEDEKISKNDLKEKINVKANDDFTGFKQEEELSKTTEIFNRSLGEHPNDINKWLKYVAFQDTVFQFEKSYRKGSIAKGLRVTAERKLSILDKALSHNPNCEQLLRERLNVAVSVYPADELYLHLEKLVQKEQGNIILWQGFIESRQCSMSHCTTPKVLELYTKCLSILHKLRRTAKLEKPILEESILRMLYQCGLFMKQAGLFEQLWKLLNLYLELNLSQNNFNFKLNIQEKNLLELEEIILKSNLPLHELWLRIEKLRECFHWLPFDGEEECEDPQRLVFSTDVAELIHPITMPDNMFKLTATILTLLKVPILPCRHSTMKNLGIDYVPWSLDSVEFLLPVFYSMHGIDTNNKYLLKYTQKLAVGPQYLKTLPHQEEYLQFVLQIMKNSADSLTGNNQTALTVWWFRFQRLLILLEKSGDFKISPSFKKKIKTNIKNVLKQDENRTNVIFFEEYAAIEFEQGNFESAINAITTVIMLNYNNKSILDLKDETDQANMSQIYRLLVEIHFKDATDVGKQQCLNYLLCFILGKDIKNLSDINTQESLKESDIKFKHMYLLLMEKRLDNLTIDGHFLPNFFTNFIMCYGWFIYITKGAIKCGTFLEDTISEIKEKYKENIWELEVIYEFYVSILYRNCLETCGMFKLLDDVLYRAIENYPNNLFLLSMLLKKQSINCTIGQPWWKMKSLILKTGHALPILFLILIANQKIVSIEETRIDTITGQKITLDDNLKNSMFSLFKRITRPDMCTRRCGLAWRLYLQFLHEYFDPKTCRNAYYQAVEECPWLKALYIDAAVYVPAELSQIQDLIIEKQLRIHVTPEELDVLRS